MRTTFKSFPLIGIIFALPFSINTNIVAGESATKETGYSLFKPTPKKQWRELSADRPDFTESPFTVDPGAFQLEMSFLSYSQDGDIKAYTIVPFNLKLGLTNNTDLQIVFDPYISIDETLAGSNDGSGDVQIRLKINISGNEERAIGIGIMPYIKLPTAAGDLGNDKAEGGIIIPFATNLADNIGLGIMFETDLAYDENDDNYDTEFVLSAAIGTNLVEILGVYAEAVGITNTDTDIDDRSMLNFGATYGASDNLVFDTGINIGLTGNTDDFNLFGGLTYRFGLTGD